MRELNLWKPSMKPFMRNGPDERVFVIGEISASGMEKAVRSGPPGAV